MRVVTICPTVERFDLAHAFEKSYSETAPSEEPAVFVVMGGDDGTAGFLSERAEKPTRRNRHAAGRPYTIIREGIMPFAQAVNRGAAEALSLYPDADALIIANDDLLLQPGWHQAAVECLSDRIDILGAKLLYPRATGDPIEKPRRIQHFGKWFTLDFFPFHVLRNVPETHEKSQEITQFPDVTFAFAAIKRDVWQSLDGLDQSYPSGFEDDDFCLRARERGATIAVDPSFSAVHRESATTGVNNEKMAEGWQIFGEKWIDTGRIQWAMGMFQGFRS